MKSGETTSGIDATMMEGGRITGTVKNAKGTALRGIWVTAYQSVSYTHLTLPTIYSV